MPGPTTLVDLLHAEAAVFADLAALAVEQRRAMLGADTAALDAIVRRAETLATRFRLVEDERRRVETAWAAERAAAGAERDEEPQLRAARAAVLEALGRLLHETAVSGAVLTRLGDSAATRQAAVGGLVSVAYEATYRADGRSAAAIPSGARLSAEG